MTLRIAVFGGGLLAVITTLLSAVRTVVLPRAAQSVITQAVFRGSAVVFRALANERRAFADRDRVMALYAPITLLLLPAVWLAVVGAGFTAMFWAAGYGRPVDALWVSGSSLLTLGVAPLPTLPFRVLGFVEAVLGLGLVALLITFLPSMYGAFARRERAVALLEVRAGSPPSAVEMLERAHRITGLDQLPHAWENWEMWFADIQESHTSYGALTWFRSPQAQHSWVTAAGTVLDTAALAISTVEGGNHPSGHLCIRSGYLALRQIASFYGVEYDPNPTRGDPISITRAEYDEACRQLEMSGLSLKKDRDTAWLDFAGWRVNYDTVLLALAELTLAPYAPWTADRSAPDHKRPRLTRWGKFGRLAPSRFLR